MKAETGQLRLVDGKLGWIYPEDGEVINES